MSSLMHKTTGATLGGQAANLRRASTPTPAFKLEFRRSVQMHPLLAGAVAALVLLSMLTLAIWQKASYSAESLIYIEPFSSKVLTDETSGNFDSTRYESSLAQQMLTAQRVDILATALGTLPHPVWSIYGETPKTAAPVLQSQLKVIRVSTSYQISISLKGPDAANTAAIVNAVTAAYLDAGRKDEISQADQRSQLLSEERSRIEAELARTRVEQTHLGTVLGVANPGVEGPNPFDARLDALRSELVQAQASHDRASAQLAAISGGSHASGLAAAANDMINNDPGLGSMKATINQRHAQLSSQMAGMTPNNPIYKSNQDELADLDKTLDSMTMQLRDRAARSLQDKLRTDLERSSDVEARINGELARQASSATSASPRLQRAAELAADVQRLTARYATVDNALRSLQLETTGPGMAHLALAASVPTAPEPTPRRLILLAALPLAMLCGLGAAVFARKRDPYLYTGVDVDDVLGFAPIATLPARGEVSEDVLDEYFLRLAAGVEGAYRSGKARTFVITAVSAETNIETLVQALDRKLVELGLGVAIVQAASVFEQQTATAGLSQLDSAQDRHFEGIAATLFSRMKTEYDVILLESPSLLISAQTEYVARCSDVTLLVAESAVTTRGELYQAGALLQRLNVTGIGLVLEQMQLRYADSVFVKGARALEGRSRRVRRQPPLAAAPVVPVPEPVGYVAEEPVSGTASSVPLPVGEVVQTEAAGVPQAKPSSPAESAWYPVHNDITPETSVEHVSEPVAVAPEAAAEGPVSSVGPVVVDPLEVETPALMALFDTHEPTRESRQPKPAEEGEDAQPTRRWFQRIFQREPEPVSSITPDKDGAAVDTPAPSIAAVPGYDASRYDLPLPVDSAPGANAAPNSKTEESKPSPVLEPVPSVAERAIYAFSSQAFTGYWVPSEPEADVPAPAQAEPTPSSPARPLSFLELSQLREASTPESAPMPEQHLEAAVEPDCLAEPAAVGTCTPAPAFALESEPAEEPNTLEPIATYAQPPPAASSAPEPVAEDWNPAPLNRWDPIPPLRPQQEPWRISGSMRIAQQSARGVWGDDELERIAPTDRWVAPEAVTADAPPSESSDIVLTRRWGLLSRFQQGESFQASRAPESHIPGSPRDAEPRPSYQQDFGQDCEPELNPDQDRRRR